MKIPARHRGRLELDPRLPEFFGDEVDDVVFDLECAGDAEKTYRLREHSVFLKHALPNHHVHETGLVLQGHENHTTGGAGTLAADDQVDVAHLRAVFARADRAVMVPEFCILLFTSGSQKKPD